MARVLFYCDVGGFGGHEIMALLIMKNMIAQGVEVHFACAAWNSRIIAEAKQIEKLRLHPLHYSLNRFSFLTNPFDFPKISSLRRLMREIGPDCIVAVQGTIEISSLVLFAAKKEGTPVITYIALAQSMKDLGAPHFRLKDAVCHRYFALPDRFITIGESQKRYLLRHGVPEHKIAVVPNVVPFELSRDLDRFHARGLLGIDQDKTWVGLVGRVFAQHKGHDYLVSAVMRNKEQFASVRFLVVGDGPDLGRIMETVKREGIESFFSFRPWTTEMNLVYSALDAVIMPSNHEGVPLVMIEAGISGLPVIASAIDGMRDYLPHEWLFPRGDVEEMTEKIMSISSTDQKDLCDKVQGNFREIFLRRTIGEEFFKELAAVFESGGKNGVSVPCADIDSGKEPCL